MRALLDTHVLLWWVTRSDELTDEVRGLFADAHSQLLWSAASAWEISIKASLGKLRLPQPAEQFLERLIPDQNLIGLPIFHDHAARAGALAQIHRDPFDRMLVAQAMVEDVPLVTRDMTLQAYGIRCMEA